MRTVNLSANARLYAKCWAAAAASYAVPLLPIVWWSKVPWRDVLIIWAVMVLVMIVKLVRVDYPDVHREERMLGMAAAGGMICIVLWSVVHVATPFYEGATLLGAVAEEWGYSLLAISSFGVWFGWLVFLRHRFHAKARQLRGLRQKIRLM